LTFDELLNQDVVLDHYNHPRNRGRLTRYNAEARDSNPSCGDEIEMQLLVENGVVKNVAFSGKGCLISQATASMLTERVKGVTVNEATALKKKDVLNLLGFPVSAVRLKCALLALKVFKLALYKKLGRELSDKEASEFKESGLD